MAKKITQLTELTTPALEDLIAIVDDPSGTPVTKKITLENLSTLPELGGFAWSEETGTTIVFSDGGAFFSTNAALATGATFTPSFGKEFIAKSELGAGGWKVEAASGVRLVVSDAGPGYGHTPTTASHAITAVDTGTKKFTVAGDQTDEFYVGQSITVSGSTGNNGIYTVVSATAIAGPSTEVVVEEAVPSATADGNIDLTGSISSVEDTASALFVYLGGNDWYCEPRVGQVDVA